MDIPDWAKSINEPEVGRCDENEKMRFAKIVDAECGKKGAKLGAGPVLEAGSRVMAPAVPARNGKADKGLLHETAPMEMMNMEKMSIEMHNFDGKLVFSRDSKTWNRETKVSDAYDNGE